MKRAVCLVYALNFFCLLSFSQVNRYWIGASSNDWNLPANWSANSGGAGGASVPTASDFVFFDANSANPCVLSGNATVSIFTMSGGNLSLSSAVASALLVNSVFNISGGVLNLGTNAANTLSIPNNTTNINGGTLNAQAATINIGNNVSVISPGTFNPGTSKVIFNGSGQQDVLLVNANVSGLFNFYNLEINKPGNSLINFTSTVTDTFQINNMLTLTAGRFSGSGFVKIEKDVVTGVNFGGSSIPIAVTGPNPSTVTLGAPFGVTGVSNFVGIAKSSPSVVVNVYRVGGDDTLRMGNFDARFIVRRGILQFPDNPPIIARFRTIEIEPEGTFIAPNNYLFNAGTHINTGGIFNANGGTYVFYYPFIPNSTQLTNNRETFNNLIIDNQTQFGPGDNDTLVVNGNLTFRSGELHGNAGSAFDIKGNMVFETGATQTFGITNLIFSGTADQSVTFAAGKEGAFNGSVYVNKPSGSLNLLSPMILDEFGGRTFNFIRGIVRTTATNLLSFRNGAFATGANNLSYVDGPVSYAWFDNFIFPTGGDGFYAPVFVTNTGADPITVQYFRQSPNSLYPVSQKEASLQNVSTREYWMLTKTGSNSPFVSLSYDNIRSGGISSAAALRVSRWDGTQWTNLGGTPVSAGDPNANFIRTTNGVPVFSPFTLGSTDAALNPLPVRLISFNVKRQAADALLEWATADEVNNDRFDIQRSVDGSQFSTIGSVPAISNSRSNQYQFLDKLMLSGKNYYRLQQVDKDGRSTLSGIVMLDNAGLLTRLKAFPNPGTGMITLEYLPWSGSRIFLEVTDLSGRSVLREQIQLNSSGRWEWKQLPAAGSYFVRLKNRGEVLQQLVIVR